MSGSPMALAVGRCDVCGARISRYAQPGTTLCAAHGGLRAADKRPRVRRRELRCAAECPRGHLLLAELGWSRDARLDQGGTWYCRACRREERRARGWS